MTIKTSAVRRIRERRYALMMLAVIAAGVAVLAILGGSTTLIFQTAMAGTPKF